MKHIHKNLNNPNMYSKKKKFKLLSFSAAINKIFDSEMKTTKSGVQQKSVLD